jgi:hypothetical protein
MVGGACFRITQGLAATPVGKSEHFCTPACSNAEYRLKGVEARYVAIRSKRATVGILTVCSRVEVGGILSAFVNYRHRATAGSYSKDREASERIDFAKGQPAFVKLHVKTRDRANP